ncbi:sulfatase-like hydrolase/transferase [Marivita sp. S6314]|nr:sulfatase-like hydrolase/transferase [Marivita sp. S6314]
MTDQQRADHLGCYGNPIVQTPNLDALAARGTRFDRFYVANPICQPNRAALATGQLTTVNGCRKNGIPVSCDSTTYADVLRAAGYRTGLVGKAHFQNVSPIEAKPPALRGTGDAPEPPFDRARRRQRSGPEYEHEIRSNWIKTPDRDVPRPYYGFDELALCIGHGDQVEGHYTGWLRDRLNGAPDPRGRDNAADDGFGKTPQVWRTALPEELYPTSFVGEQACAFLEQTDDRPFLLLASFPDPHHPFTPPGRYFDMYDPAQIPLPESFAYKTGDRNDLPAHLKRVYQFGDEKPDAYWPFHAEADTIRRMIALNYGAITMVDDWVGRILQVLERTGLSENTHVIFMSDHGDYMGDHGTTLKHGVHSHGLIRVPMIWADPTRKTGVSSEIQGSAIDFAPTLLARAGLQEPVGMQGRDLLAEDAENLPVLIEDAGLSFADPDGKTASRTLVHEGWRMTVFEGSELGELYDLEKDPSELSNLWSDGSAAQRRVRMLYLLADRQMALQDASLVPTHQA